MSEDCAYYAEHPERITPEPGFYRLWFDLREETAIDVGALGRVRFLPGRYVYTGSARRGVRARVLRHCRPDKPMRWHLDYLLPRGRLVGIEAFPAAEGPECTLNREALALPEADVPARGFGASDCRCPAHLVRVPSWMPVPQRTQVCLPSGDEAEVRLLQAGDAERLADYFGRLGPGTRARFGPHAFDADTARQICAELNWQDMLRVVAIQGGRIIAYLLVKRGMWESDARRYAERGIALDAITTGTLAPSVADDYQNQGVASAVMPILLSVCRSLGLRRLVLWGGVIADNYLAQGFYRKWGFRKVGEFTTSVLNYDMMAEIPAE